LLERHWEAHVAKAMQGAVGIAPKSQTAGLDHEAELNSEPDVQKNLQKYLQEQNQQGVVC
jgi:hypothetical protein